LKLKPFQREEALDWPWTLKDDLVVIWWGNEYRWPDEKREIRYLSDQHLDTMKGYALAVADHRWAVTFVTGWQAKNWLMKHESKRGAPYSDFRITTVAELKADRFPVPAIER